MQILVERNTAIVQACLPDVEGCRMRYEQITRVHRAAVLIYGEGKVAAGIAAMEGVYLDHLADKGSPDTDTALQLFAADMELFWFEEWQRARSKGE